MARSRIYETQVLDSDFLSEEEASTISGVLQSAIDAKPEKLIDLTDTPTTYNGLAGKYGVVNDTEDGLDFDYCQWDPSGPLIPETAVSGTYFVNFEGGRLLVGATGSKPELVYLGPTAGLAFDDSKTESCYGIFKIPFTWNTESPIKLTINYMNDTTQTASGTIAWDIEYHTYAPGESYGDKTVTHSHVHADLPICSAGTFFTHVIEMDYYDEYNPLARGDILTFEFYRDGADSLDTVVGDAILLALMFELQIGQNAAGV